MFPFNGYTKYINNNYLIVMSVLQVRRTLTILFVDLCFPIDLAGDFIVLYIITCCLTLAMFIIDQHQSCPNSKRCLMCAMSNLIIRFRTSHLFLNNPQTRTMVSQRIQFQPTQQPGFSTEEAFANVRSSCQINHIFGWINVYHMQRP